MKTTMYIKGMHCESCKAVIEDVCRDVAGVRNCVVDFKTGKVTIEHDNADLGRLKKEIESAGEYKVVSKK